MIGESDWDNADWFERFFHELSHPFINLQSLEHWRCSGIGEGWAEFCQAYVPQRLECLGPPYKGRFDWYVNEFRKCGLAEYLHTRLPIEEIISYGPSSSLLMALLLTAGDSADSVNWAPFKQLFGSAAKVPPPRTPINDWPSVLAYDAMTYFDPGRVRPILRKYRFPPEPFIADVPRMRSSIPTQPLDCAARRARWSAGRQHRHHGLEGPRTHPRPSRRTPPPRPHRRRQLRLQELLHGRRPDLRLADRRKGRTPAARSISEIYPAATRRASSISTPGSRRRQKALFDSGSTAMTTAAAGSTTNASTPVGPNAASTSTRPTTHSPTPGPAARRSSSRSRTTAALAAFSCAMPPTKPHSSPTEMHMKPAASQTASVSLSSSDRDASRASSCCPSSRRASPKPTPPSEPPLHEL